MSLSFVISGGASWACDLRAPTRHAAPAADTVARKRRRLCVDCITCLLSLKSRQIENADPAHRVARVASGHAAAPPRNVMNSRRLMGLTPKAKDRGLSIAGLECQWGALQQKWLLTLLQHWSGAVMCPACLCGGEAAGHNALRGSGPNR